MVDALTPRDIEQIQSALLALPVTAQTDIAISYFGAP